MKKTNLFFCLFMAILLFTGCSKNGGTAVGNSGSENTGIVTKENESTENEENPPQNEVAMLDFFLPDGSKAHYQGEGNEFAELDIEVAHPFKDYVIIHENNGGSLVRHIYKIENDKIIILEKMMIDYKQDFPTQKELDAMAPSGIYLKKPFTVGTAFGNWSIIETDVSVETPYQTFDHAFIIEMKENDIINRKYFVKGFGEIKRESIMKTTDGEFVVISTLKSVEK